jgi:hypothetical protein
MNIFFASLQLSWTKHLNVFKIKIKQAEINYDKAYANACLNIFFASLQLSWTKH